MKFGWRQILTLLVLMVASFLVGCTSTYTVHLREGATQKPITGALVTVATVPRIYSFLDPRHYMGESGKQFRAERKTDSRGSVTLEVPSDLDIWYVSLGDSWVIQEPSSQWAPMLTREEFEAEVPEGNLKQLPDRPHVKVETK